MRFLGIDYGEKRIGLAISDEGGKIAFPKSIVVNSEKLIEEVLKVCEKENVNEIVVGESLDYKGEPNKIEKNIVNFIEELEKRIKIPINRQKEFLTSIEARKGIELKSLGSKVDDSAAALILQRYLDKINNIKS